MALTPIEVAGPLLIRASCFVCVVLALMVVYVLADLWRIERRLGRPISAIGLGLLAAAVLMVGIFFGKCALTGACPHAPVTGGCP